MVSGVTTSYSAEALGQVIRELREGREPSMSQDELGRRANYGAGRGVSISRIETGANRPSAQRFRDIAESLGVEEDQLAELARARTAVIAERQGTGTDTSPRSRRRATRDRLQSIQELVKARTDRIEELGTAFNEAHELARDRFFLEFVAAANAISGAQVPELPAEEPRVDSSQDSQPEAAADGERLSGRIAGALADGAGGAARAGMGGAAAYSTFSAAAVLGAASIRGAGPGLSGVAATNSTLALLGGGTLPAGGAGIARGMLLLTGIVAAPLTMLAAGGLFLVARRRSKQEDERLTAQLDQSEAAIVATQEGFDALADVLPRATDLLVYIGTHAAHALDRWRQSIGAGAVDWRDLTPGQRQAYRDFVSVAACELSVDGIDAGKFMTTEGDDRKRFIAAVDETLLHADRTVRALV